MGDVEDPVKRKNYEGLGDYYDTQFWGLVRTGAFAVAWLVAILTAIGADSKENKLSEFKADYDNNLSSLAFLQLGGFLGDLAVHGLKLLGGKSVLLDLLREGLIVGTACLGLIGFVAGMVKLDGKHAASMEHQTAFLTAVATYSYLASAILAGSRAMNMDLRKQSELRKQAIVNSSVGQRYNKVPQVEAHNFY